MSHFDVIVIGAGASGLMCAMTAGQRGRKVLVVDRANKVGKKILMSGGGRCNFTNLFVEPDNFLSNNPHFVISALNRYTQWDFIALVEKYKIAYEERKHGQLFCKDSAKDILNMLLAECEKVGVTIQTHCDIQKVTALDHESTRFSLQTNKGGFSCESLVVASGGLSIPTLGSSGFGYDLAKQFGHHVFPTRAGLVPFTFTDHLKPVCEKLSGLAMDVVMSVPERGFQENILFTHRGMSGPVVLQVSNYWHSGDNVSINLLPNENMGEWLLVQKKASPKTLIRTQLAGFFAKSLLLELQSLLWADFSEKPLADIPDASLMSIGDSLNNWQVKPSGTEGYRTAEVTLGGVDTNELSSKTMESKKQSGLYFIGEVMDVTGHLGGFNFQWAWSCGNAAGQYV